MTYIEIPAEVLGFLIVYGVATSIALIMVAYSYWKLMNKAEALERRIWAAQDALREE